MKNESEATEKAAFWGKIRAKLGLKAGEKTPRGHALAVKLNSTRSKRARTMDGRQTARHLYRKPTDENIEKWVKNPGRTDFLKIDNEGRHAGSARARLSAPSIPGEPERALPAEAALTGEYDLGFGDLRYQPNFLESTGRSSFEGRYTWDKVKSRFMRDRELERQTSVGPINQYQRKLGDVRTYLIERQDVLCLKKSKGEMTREDRQEERRLKVLEQRLNRAASRSMHVEEQIQRYRPLSGTKASVKTYKPNVTLNPANQAALESLQACEREFGAGVDNLSVPARRHPNHWQERQGIIAVPMDPGHAEYPQSDADLLVHTHPNRMNTGKLDNVPAPIQASNSPGHRIDRSHPVEFARLNELVKSIHYDDSPSGGDLICATGTDHPSMIVTPRKNILLTPGPGTIPQGVGGKLTDKTSMRKREKELWAIIEKADNFAFDKAAELNLSRNKDKALVARSLPEVRECIDDYQRRRVQAISAALEKETQMQVRFYDKGEPIKYPGEQATTPERAGKKTRAQKKAEKRG